MCDATQLTRQRDELGDGGLILIPLEFRLELQSMAALLTVLTTIARVGGQMTSIRAAEFQAVIGVQAPPRVAHALRARLDQIVDVIQVTEAVPGAPPRAPVHLAK